MKHDQTNNNLNTTTPTLLQRYTECHTLRAIVQALPHIGGAVDTLLSGRTSKIQQQRITQFLNELDRRLAAVESTKTDLSNEGFSDLMLSTFEAVARTRSDQKRSRFAEIISNQITRPTLWDEPENAVRLLSGLEDIHVEIIALALTIPEAEEPFSGLRVVFLADKSIDSEEQNAPVSLLSSFPQYGTGALQMACAELVAKGLLRDSGIGRWSMGAMTHFSPTDLTEWLYGWIKLSDQN